MRRLLALLAPALLSFAVGCGSDGVTDPTPASVAGIWNLSTVNGAALPLLLQAANPKVELLEDQIVLSSAGTYTETFNLRFTSSTGEVTSQAMADAGTFTVTGSLVKFVSSGDGGAFTASVTGDRFTIAFSGVSQLFIRQ